MERCRDCDLLDLLGGARQLCYAQICDAVDVIPIPFEIAAQCCGMDTQDRVKGRNLEQWNRVVSCRGRFP